ncbi:MAG: hypothetical protein QOD06_2091, partial [Candidatus Binatota bacterium]|nr:hypothetical protein [Candidatus Binatota bacterium]
RFSRDGETKTGERRGGEDQEGEAEDESRDTADHQGKARTHDGQRTRAVSANIFG